jgi:hypothetical protein
MFKLPHTQDSPSKSHATNCMGCKNTVEIFIQNWDDWGVNADYLAKYLIVKIWIFKVLFPHRDGFRWEELGGSTRYKGEIFKSKCLGQASWLMHVIPDLWRLRQGSWVLGHLTYLTSWRSAWAEIIFCLKKTYTEKYECIKKKRTGILGLQVDAWKQWNTQGSSWIKSHKQTWL